MSFGLFPAAQKYTTWKHDWKSAARMKHVKC